MLVQLYLRRIGKTGFVRESQKAAWKRRGNKSRVQHGWKAWSKSCRDGGACRRKECCMNLEQIKMSVKNAIPWQFRYFIKLQEAKGNLIDEDLFVAEFILIARKPEEKRN